MRNFDRRMIWIIAVSLSLLAVIPCTAGRLRVPQDFPTVQSAVDNASAGDIIVLAFQYHYGSVLIENRSDLEIRGGNGLIFPNPWEPTGIHIKNSTNIRLDGFEVRNFEQGVLIEDSTFCSLSGLKIRFNVDVTPGSGQEMGDGVVLLRSNQNDIVRNEIFDNSNNGIVLTGGSSGNTIRSNNIYNNGLPAKYPEIGGSGIILNGGSQQDNMISGNTLENNGWGILIGPAGGSSENQISRNKSTANKRAGIALRGAAGGNLVSANDAQGNNVMDLAPSAGYDIFDDSSGKNNRYDRNRGTFGP